MEQGVDPVTISALRVGVSACFLLTLGSLWQHRKTETLRHHLTWRLLVWVGGSGFVGMALGMSLLLFALAGGAAGIVTTLSATTPVMMLPLLWLKARERPALGSWVGAALTVIGSGILFKH